MPSEVNVINGNDNRSRSTSPQPNKQGTEEQKPRRFQNGWTKEQERLMADWSDIAICYRWLHDRSDKTFHVKTLSISLPVIFLSTLSGFANIGVQAILNSEEEKKYASFAIAGVSLMAGLLTTIGDRLRYAQLEESHRVAAIAWGKFQRLIAVELALNPDDRMDSLDFLKICRADLDRLIEQSPPIPKESISLFENKFGKIKDLKKPDVCGALEHTRVFESSETRLKHMAVEASLMLKRKKQTLNELLSSQVEKKIAEQIEQRLAEAVEDRKTKLKEELELKRLEEVKLQEDINRAVEERSKKIQEQIEIEKKQLKIQTPQEPQSKVTNSQFESRLNYRRSSTVTTGKSRLSPITPSITPLQEAKVEKAAPKEKQEKQENEIVIPEVKQEASSPKSDDAIVIVSRN